MKLFHISDLHIGKRLRETDFIQDQIYILNQIVELVDKEQPDGIIMAGDIYDRSVPPAYAVSVFDDFLTKLARRDISIFVISGNHDSPERLNFGKTLFGKTKVHIAGTFEGKVERIEVRDEYGALYIHLLPFIKPSTVRNYMPEKDIDKSINTYEDAVKAVIDETQLDTDKRNLLVAHQYITNMGLEPERSDSELTSIGGLDFVDVSVFDQFDYVALGHIHGPQKIGRETVRYSGSPLKYSFSECNHKKSVTCITLREKGDILIDKLPLIPIRDLRVVKDTLDNLLNLEEYTKANCEDYLRVILTDEEDLYDPIGKLRTKYPNVVFLEIENTKHRESRMDAFLPSGNVRERNILDLFEEFYENQNNVPLSEEQRNILLSICEEMGEL